MVNLNFLSDNLRTALKKTDINILSEIRLRQGFAVFGIFGGEKVYLSESGPTLNKGDAIICSGQDILRCMEFATEKSLYAFNDRLKRGFLTTKDGVRIGVAGDCVFEDDRIVTVKNISSLNIRIPHEIKDCSQKIYNKLFLREVFNTLIIAPPSKGKTTILKDLARKLNDYLNSSILIIDERGEFSTVCGENIDVVKFSNKLYALEYSIRSMSPQIVITDELQSCNDWQSAKIAAFSGVKIIASCHGKSIEDLRNKDYFIKNVFERYIVLDAEKSAGTVKGFYDGDFNEI
ncbi:MAG: hypothetical protein J5911_02445 [Clostridia bacterium]|nr:hypothetical protein [Clostridia bacterium]